MRKHDSELVIASEDSVEDLVPISSPRIRFVRTPAGLSLGEKHNAAVRRCRYEWLAKWDDDDWHAPRRLGLTLRRLRMEHGLIAGTRELLFHELRDSRRSFLYTYEGSRPWVSGNTLVFHRSVWEQTLFPDRDRGVDTRFSWQALDSIPAVVIGDIGLVVVFQHGQSTGRRVWRPEPPEYRLWAAPINDVLGGDLALYENALARATVPV
jgi:hypothetical protein